MKIFISLLILINTPFVYAEQSENIQGYTVIYSDDVDVNSRSLIRDELNLDLIVINNLFDSEILNKINKVKIWVTKNGLPEGSATYHQSANWLSQNGKNPRMAHGIEIGNIDNFIKWRKLNQPYMLLHEIAHFYHDRVLGNEDADIKNGFNRIKESQLYEMVSHNMGGKQKAYALTNRFEYFAESTESFFGKNDFFPYDQEDLKGFDFLTYLLIKEKWRVK
jgi:hypothetical protein